MNILHTIATLPAHLTVPILLAAVAVACCADVVWILVADERLERFLRAADAADARQAAAPPPPPLEQAREDAAHWAHDTTSLTVVIATQQGVKRGGIRSHRAPGWYGTLRWVAAGARWRVRTWWAATAPVRPDEPVRRALTASSEQVAPAWLVVHR